MLLKLFDRYLYFSNQIESDLQNLNDTRSFVLKQSFGIFNLLDAKQKNYTKEDVIGNLFSIKKQNKNHFKKTKILF